MSTKQRKINEKRKRRQDILDAAREIFFSKGLGAATMEEIAVKAELSKGTLYLYFKSKEELYVSLIDEGSRLFFEHFTKAASAKLNATKQIQNLINAFYAFYAEHRQYYEILFWIQNGSIAREKLSDEVHAKVHGAALNILDYVKNVIKNGIASGEFVNVDPWEMTLSFWSLATGIFSISGFVAYHELGKVKDKRLLDFASNILLSRLKNSPV